MDKEFFMTQALLLAKEAADEGEVQGVLWQYPKDLFETFKCDTK